MRVIVAEDSVLFREGLARILTGAGFSIMAQVSDVEQLMRELCADQPDLVVTDIRMPPTHTIEGLRAAREIRAQYPEVGILLLSQYIETQYLMQLISDGSEGMGYLLKDRVANLDEFVSAVQRISAGGSVIDSEVVRLLLNRESKRDTLGNLTDREREVLGLMAAGRSNQAIAERICVSGKTVEAYVRNIFIKLDLPATVDDHRRVLAVITYLKS